MTDTALTSVMRRVKHWRDNLPKDAPRGVYGPDEIPMRALEPKFSCPFPGEGTKGAPLGYRVDPGQGSGMDHLVLRWPSALECEKMAQRDGRITALWSAKQLADEYERRFNPASYLDGGAHRTKGQVTELVNDIWAITHDSTLTEGDMLRGLTFLSGVATAMLMDYKRSLPEGE